jgi:hypothetical protein
MAEWQAVRHVGLQPGFRAPGTISRLTELHFVMYIAKGYNRYAMAAQVIWSHIILSRLLFHIEDCLSRVTFLFFLSSNTLSDYVDRVCVFF